MKTEKEDKPVRMSYDTYALLKAFLDNEILKAHVSYVDALRFIPTGYKHQKIRDHAWNIYDAERDKLELMKIELKEAVQAAYRDHPNPEMREFWGIKEKPLTESPKPV